MKTQTPEQKARFRLYAAERKKRLREAGLCVECSRPAAPCFLHCQRCLDSHRVGQRRAAGKSARPFRPKDDGLIHYVPVGRMRPLCYVPRRKGVTREIHEATCPKCIHKHAKDSPFIWGFRKKRIADMYHNSAGVKIWKNNNRQNSYWTARSPEGITLTVGTLRDCFVFSHNWLQQIDDQRRELMILQYRQIWNDLTQNMPEATVQQDATTTESHEGSQHVMPASGAEGCGFDPRRAHQVDNQGVANEKTD